MGKLLKYHKLITIGIVAMLLIPMLYHLFKVDAHLIHENSNVHSIIEAIGGVIGILITILIYKKYNKDAEELDYPFIALAFLSMGVFDLIHAFSSQGNSFVFSHVFSVFSGSIFFLVLVLPISIKSKIRTPINFRIILSIGILMVFLTMYIPKLLPIMIDSSGFTLFSKLINFVSAGAFFIGLIHLYKRFLKTHELDIYLIVIVALIQVISRITFTYSHLWNTDWWVWHIYRFVGYAIIFYALVLNLNKLFDQLNRANKTQRTILDAMPFGTLLIGYDKKIIQANQTAQSLLGYDQSELIDSYCYDTICGASCHNCQIIDHNKPILSEQKVIIHKNKQEIPILKTVIPINYHDREVLLECFVDLSDTLKAQEELKNNEQKFREIFDSMVNSVFVIDNDLRIVDANKKACQQYGYTKEEFLKISPPDFIHPDYLAEFERFNAELQLQGHFCGHTIDLKKTGEPFYTEVNGTIVTFNNQPHLLAVVVDISEKIKAEQDLKNTLNDLVRSNKELEQFAYVASHDLQEPLRKMKNYTDLVLKLYSGQFDDKGEYYLKVITNGAHRMQILLNELLLISRISTGSFKLVNCDLNTVVNDALKVLKTKIIAANATIEFNELCSVTAYPSKIKDVFVELIDNAIKFNDSKTPLIKINCSEHKTEWVVELFDNGIGFEMQYSERIFVIFQKLHARDVYAGTGVGLTKCKKIIERHGGKIWCVSDVNKGTTISFSLPKIREL